MKAGELCAGYGGLHLGLKEVLPDLDLAWYAEFDKAASQVMAAHHPGVTNYGDMTRIDWQEVPPVEVLAGGTPCQDVSAAGRRAGMVDGTRSNLWVCMREAISVLRPRLVVWENVRGALSARAESREDDRAMEPDPGLLGGGAVDLLSGQRVVWSETWPVSGMTRSGSLFARPMLGLAIGGSGCSSSGGLPIPRSMRGGSATEMADMLPTPTAAYGGGSAEAHLARKPGRSEVTDLGMVVEQLLPTPRAADHAASMGAPGVLRHVEAGNGSLGEVIGAYLPTPTASEGLGGAYPQREGHLPRVGDIVVFHLPTPTAFCGTGGARDPEIQRENGSAVSLLDLAERGRPEIWGKYAAAIARHESIVGPAPAPTEPTKTGKRRLSSRFVEWMMMLPPGHVTGRGLSRVAELRMLGNGVVPAQAAHAFRIALERNNDLRNTVAVMAEGRTTP